MSRGLCVALLATWGCALDEDLTGAAFDSDGGQAGGAGGSGGGAGAETADFDGTDFDSGAPPGEGGAGGEGGRGAPDVGDRCGPQQYLWEGRCHEIPDGNREATGDAGVHSDFGGNDALFDYCNFFVQLADGICTDDDEDGFPRECVPEIGTPDTGFDGEFVGNVALAEAIAERLLRCRDCDDTNAKIHPAAPELCNGLDDNCDGRADEDFFEEHDSEGAPVPSPCVRCGLDGLTACNAQDPEGLTTLCVPTPPDEEAPIPVVRCDAVGEDCQSLIDSRCVLFAEADQGALGGSPVALAACGGEALLLQTREALVRTVGNRPDAIRTLANFQEQAEVVAATCDVNRNAWIQPSTPCGVNPTTPWSCNGTLMLLELGGDEVVHGGGTQRLGPPVLLPDAVWTTVADFPPNGQAWAAIEARSWIPGEAPGVMGSAPLPGALFRSDPTPPVRLGEPEVDRVALLRWSSGETRRPSLYVETVGGQLDDACQVDEGDFAGAAAFSADWLVWPAGPDSGALRAVESSAVARDQCDRVRPPSFQFTRTTGPHLSPRLSGDVVIWLDDTQEQGRLRWFDLRTGVDGTLADGVPGPEAFAVRDGWVWWIAADVQAMGTSKDVVYRRRLIQP